MLSCCVGFQETSRQESLDTCRHSENYCFDKFQVKAGAFLLTKDLLPMLLKALLMGQTPAGLLYSLQVCIQNPAHKAEKLRSGGFLLGRAILENGWMGGWTGRCM